MPNAALATAAGFEEASVRIVHELEHDNGRTYPLFLLTAFADTGTVGSNPCVQAVERANQAAEIDDSR